MPEAFPRFFVEETSFQLSTAPSPDVLEQRLTELIELIEACRDKGEQIVRSTELFEMELSPGVLLVDLLFQPVPSFQLDRIVLRALQTALFRCVEWPDRLDPEPDSHVEIAAVPCSARTVAVVHALANHAHGAACLCLGIRPDRSGELPVLASGVERDLYFLTAKSMLPYFYRSLFEIENLDADAYMANAANAFPEIAFAPGLASQFSRFDTRYRDVRPMVTLHLSVLNDHLKVTVRAWTSGEPLARAVPWSAHDADIGSSASARGGRSSRVGLLKQRRAPELGSSDPAAARRCGRQDGSGFG